MVRCRSRKFVNVQFHEKPSRFGVSRARAGVELLRSEAGHLYGLLRIHREYDHVEKQLRRKLNLPVATRRCHMAE